MNLGDYKIHNRRPAGPDPAEEVRRIGAEMMQQLQALRADVYQQQLHQLRHAQQEVPQPPPADSGILLRLEALHGEVKELLKQPAASAAVYPGAMPGAFPGAIAALGPLYPGGADPIGRLYTLLTTAQSTADLAVPLAGGTMSGTLAFSTDSPLSLNGYYTITTNNLGAGGHEATGPRFMINNVPDGRNPFTINSLGEVSLILQDTSLDNVTVAHGIQLRRRPTGSGSASGIGSGVQMFCSDSSALDSDIEVANLQYIVTDVTPGAMDAVIRLRAVDNGTNKQIIQLWGNGKIEATNTTDGGWFQVAETAFVGTAAHGAFNAGNVAFDGSGSAFTGLSGGTGFAANFGAGYTGRFLDLQLAGVSLVRVGPNGQTVFTVSDTANTSPSAPFVLDHVLSSGSPSTGFGTTLTWNVRDTANSSVTGAQVQVTTTTATPGSVTTQYVMQHRKAGAVTSAAYIDASSNFQGLFKIIAAAGLGSGGTAAATTLASPGTVVAKFPLYDSAGTLLGYAPVYNTGSFS